MERLAQDITYALRTLARNRIFAAAAIVSLAMPIAVNASIFSIVNALLLRLPNVERPRELVGVYSDLGPRGPIRYIATSYPDYAYFRDHNAAFTGLLAYSDVDVVLGDGAEAETVPGQLVTGNFFEVLGLRPAVGRLLAPTDDQPSQAQVAVIDHTLWETRYQSNPSVIGQTLRVNRQLFTIVGVMPASYDGVAVGPRRQVVLPIAAQQIVMSGGANLMTSRGNRWLNVAGRLKPGVPEATALADLKVAAGQLKTEFPGTNRNLGVAVAPLRMVPLTFKGMVVRASTILMAAVAFILLISCANLTNLLLMRGNSRRTEFATRLALGASRGRLVRQLLTESLVLAACGGVAGFATAVLIARVLSTVQRPPGPLSLALTMTVDWRVGVFVLGVAVIAGLAVGLLPALWASRADLTSFLKQDTQRAGRSTSNANRVLVMVQVSVSIVLLAGAGLALRSLAKVQAIEPGFRPDGVYASVFQLKRQKFPDGRMEQFYRQVIDRVGGVPGVQGVSTTSHLPMSGMVQTKKIVIDPAQQSAEDPIEVDESQVGPGYFKTMGIALLSGRDFGDADVQTINPDLPPEQIPVIVNEAMARQFWPGDDAVGKMFRLDERNDKSVLMVIGIVRDSKYRSLAEEARPYMFRPLRFAEEAPWGKQLLIKTSDHGASQLALVRRAIDSVEPGLPPAKFQSVEEYVSGALFPARLLAALLATFGMLALALQTVGLYGVTAYSIVQRRRELAIRHALGAPRLSLIKAGVGGVLFLVATGAILGVLGARLATRGLGAYLYGIQPSDIPTLAVVVAVQLLAALVAAYAPLRRSIDREPGIALREP